MNFDFFSDNFFGQPSPKREKKLENQDTQTETKQTNDAIGKDLLKELGQGKIITRKCKKDTQEETTESEQAEIRKLF